VSRGKSIEKSKWKQEIDWLLDAGFSIDNIVNYMQVAFGEKIARRTLYEYKSNYHKELEERKDKLPARLIVDGRKFKWLDIVRIREEIICVCVERIKKGREKEEQIGLPMKNVDEAIQKLNDVLNDLKQDYIDLGLLQRRPEKLAIDVNTEDSKSGRSRIDKALNGISRGERSKIAGAIGKELIARLKDNATNHRDEPTS